MSTSVCFNFVSVVTSIEIKLTKVKLGCELPKRRGKKRVARKKLESLKSRHFTEVKESWFLEIKT